MEQKQNNLDHNETGKPVENSTELTELLDKVNIDQAAIDEAREAVGNDEEKIKTYLINNRGL